LNKRPRIIPTLLIENSDLVKTTKFKKPGYLGDPINALKIFNEKGVDEICVMDIQASKNGAGPNYDLLKEMASEAFMPLSYGGGITSISDMTDIFRLGYEKVIINTAWTGNNSLVREASERFGSQSIIVSIDYKRRFGRYQCYTHDGTNKIKCTPIEMAKMAEKCGAGELLLYSIDRDGTRSGYDVETINQISHMISIPLIACGGAGSIADIKAALAAGADAVAAGSIFVYFGDINAVLINYPDFTQFVNHGIYDKELAEYEL